MFVTQIVCACADVVKHEDPHIRLCGFFSPLSVFSERICQPASPWNSAT